jgi:cytochrome c biogenesis protein CcdA
MSNSPASSHRRRRQSRVLRVIGWIAIGVLSLLYYTATAMLLLFGYIVGWDNEPARPLAGVAMIVAGVLVFIFMPRLIKRVTGREVLTPRHPAA